MPARAEGGRAADLLDAEPRGLPLGRAQPVSRSRIGRGGIPAARGTQIGNCRALRSAHDARSRACLPVCANADTGRAKNKETAESSKKMDSRRGSSSNVSERVWRRLTR